MTSGHQGVMQFDQLKFSLCKKHKLAFEKFELRTYQIIYSLGNNNINMNSFMHFDVWCIPDCPTFPNFLYNSHFFSPILAKPKFTPLVINVWLKHGSVKT